MNAAAERRREDLKRLQVLCGASEGRLRLLACSGDPPTDAVVELACRTAGSRDYPDRAVEQTRVAIWLPARYPFDRPRAMIQTTIFHPNVYPSGQICFGSTWLATEGLDLLVKQIARIVVFDPDVVNVDSPANARAAAWYSEALKHAPGAFPTDRLNFLFVQPSRTETRWRNLVVEAPPPARRTVRCAQCVQQLRVPDLDGTTVRCPTCGHVFQVSR